MSLITPEFAQRVPDAYLTSGPPPGSRYYRLIRAEYVPDGATRFGPNHHILVDVWDVDGNRKFDVPVQFFWRDGAKIVLTNKRGVPYAADFAMFEAGYSYGVRIGEWPYKSTASDEVFGMGLGRIGSEYNNDHVDYFLIFQEIISAGGGVETPVDDRDVQIADLARQILALVE